MDSKTNQTVQEVFCAATRRPRLQSRCFRRPCPFDWVEEAWSECSQTCGGGRQFRTVSCRRLNAFGWVDPEPVAQDKCDATLVPAASQRCNAWPCDAPFTWQAAEWGPCSAPCGRKGRQTRRLFCRRRDGRMAPRYNCPREHKPPRKRKCNQRKCGMASCADAQRVTGSSVDAEYLLVVGGKNMSVYCAGMNTSSPAEYLTLPAGERDNHAEIYDLSLLRRRSCPYGGARNDNCTVCTANKRSPHGLTAFSRVRLDVATLRVRTDDWTFSRQVKGKHLVKYGEAGDCYSSLSCPQGRFSINLSGTAFKVSEATTWAEYGKDPSIRVNRYDGGRKVQGKCGGYCGGCRPFQGLKLDVLPP